MGKFTDYKLQLKSLPEGVHKMSFKMGKPFFINMDNTDIHDANLVADLELTYRNGIYDLNFHITGEVVVLCDRCLDDLVFPIDTTYHIVVRYGDKYNDEGDEYLEIPESDTYLNVAYMLYDTVALAIPIKHVHPLGKCNRQMSALLKKHRSERQPDEIDDFDSDADFEIEGGDVIETDIPSSDEEKTDPRWDKLKNLKSEE
ncbi:MAG: DUF177 domain-containing protein [Muribaculaceae bacterium]|nr:DUF177 domain-containing protein [Muribaculaceae bacterium]